MQTTRKTWIAGSVLVAVLVLVAAWLLLLAPVRSEAATSRADAEQVELDNEALELRVVDLRKKYAEIETYRDELASYQEQIAPTVDYESIVKEIERSVEKAKVDLISIESDAKIELVTPYTAIKKVTPAPKSEDGEEQQPSATPTAEETATVSGLPPTETGALSTDIDGFYQVPLAITVQGDYEEILKFSEQLQIHSTRLILVSNLEIEALSDRPAGTDAPESKVGDISYVVHTLAYVLQGDETKVKADDAEDIAETKLPAIGKKNVFAPER